MDAGRRTGGSSDSSSLTSALKQFVERYPGKLPYYRWRLATRRAARLPALARYESAEAARALAMWGRRPVGSVATIIPTHKRPLQLLQAVESALAQTVTDQVVVVIDDGAGLPPLPSDPRLFAYSLSRNCGVAGVVRNVGLRASASRYVAFLDDDNVWYPHHLEVSLAGHAEGAEVTYTAIERVVAGSDAVMDVLSVPFDRRLLANQGMCDTNTLVIRRTAGVRFSRVPLRHGDFPLEDWELVHRLSRHMATRHLPTVTARYLVHDGSFFTDWDAARREAARRASGG